MSGRFLLIVTLSFIVAMLIGAEVREKWMIPKEPLETRKLRVGEKIIKVEVVDTPAKMSRGLGYRDSLDGNSGMLFVYPQPTIPSFWMKGMRFPLDFVWISEGMVVEITESVQNPTNEEERLEMISPDNEVNWVLEVNEGFVRKNGIKVGDEVVLID